MIEQPDTLRGGPRPAGAGDAAVHTDDHRADHRATFRGTPPFPAAARTALADERLRANL
ncbi:MAG: hypothetical protein HKP61_10050, partial [Dactylosporangium sp.]|nr:hypothetical protein [Dactylosporangium sp.]